MLDIIITHYDEPWFICRKLFQSLDIQRIVNWDEIKVTVVNDGGHRFPEEKQTGLPFPTVQVDIPKSGISAARNTGIAMATEPWIMFCDCDDSFTHIYALDEILSELRKPSAQQYDMMWTHCLTEFGRMVCKIADEHVFDFVHCKAYRREFLLYTGIRFDELLNYGEDTEFNERIMRQTDRIKEICSTPPYVWIRRGGSVTTSGRRAL